MLGSIAAMAGAVLQAAGSVVGVRHRTEEPAHTREQLTGNVEIRCYGDRIAAETIVTSGEEAARSIGFRRLAGYIFGGNHSRAKFAMTAPVAQTSDSRVGQQIAMTAPVAQQAGTAGQWVIRFFLPAGTSLESLPEPDDPTVQLVHLPAETVAVHSFSGARGRRAVAEHTAKLLNVLRDKDFQAIGAPQAWFYDPPWTIPVFRRNEIAVPVKTNH